jgi:hypothetical protein
MKLHLTLIAVTILLMTLSGVAEADDSPPNVVLIYTDDVGYGDVGAYGATMIPTPNIDRLAG